MSDEDDFADRDDDWDIEAESCGSCDNCGVNLYGDEHSEGYCDQCSWGIADAQPRHEREDVS